MRFVPNMAQMGPFVPLGRYFFVPYFWDYADKAMFISSCTGLSKCCRSESHLLRFMSTANLATAVATPLNKTFAPLQIFHQSCVNWISENVYDVEACFYCEFSSFFHEDMSKMIFLLPIFCCEPIFIRSSSLLFFKGLFLLEKQVLWRERDGWGERKREKERSSNFWLILPNVWNGQSWAELNRSQVSGASSGFPTWMHSPKDLGHPPPLF